MIITAKFNSQCSVCGKSIKRGEPIDWERGRKAVSHAACSPSGVAYAASSQVAWNARNDFDKRDHSSQEDRCCGDSAYEDRCFDAINY